MIQPHRALQMRAASLPVQVKVAVHPVRKEETSSAVVPEDPVVVGTVSHEPTVVWNLGLVRI